MHNKWPDDYPPRFILVFIFVLRYNDDIGGRSTDGVSKPVQVRRNICGAHCAVFCITTKNKLLAPGQEGLLNTPNKQHNSLDCFEPPDHLDFPVVFVFYKQRGKEMKKYIITSIILTIIITPAMASKVKLGDDHRCVVNHKGNDHFYWCGKQTDFDKKRYCAGIINNKKNAEFDKYNGDAIETGGRYFVCCGGTSEKQGEWHETDSTYYIKEEIKTVEIKDDSGKAIGTCTYQSKINACGDELGTVCTTPTPCESGTIRRNAQCVKVCAPGYGFVSATLNDCIECTTTLVRGIDDTGTCTKCDTNDDEIFNKDEKKCVKSTRYTKSEMDKCWICQTQIAFKSCLNWYRDPTDVSTDDITAMKKDCHITEDTDTN